MNARSITAPTAPGKPTAGLALLALGIVYGDIGTSPLYAVKETFNPDHGIPLTHASILGGVSAIFWTLMIIVSLKYVLLALAADNRGEGGIMALLSLIKQAFRERPRARTALVVAGLCGAALFYGDAVLTPAISVLSAVEGLEVGTDAFKPYVVPLAVAILVALFAIQRYGTAVVGLLFGPICALWFVALAACGLVNIAAAPQILAALDPTHALRFVTAHGFASFLVLGSVLLAITGAEALYADMGHFGRRAVRVSWFALVAPSLVLNYLGQGALLMTTPAAVTNPFYLAFPSWALYPVVVLATAATVIASQATISGAYSMTQQAIQLGYLPRMAVQHTSDSTRGQIYMPAVNVALLIAVLAAVVGFGSSSRLASAYGVAVMGTMLATTILASAYWRARWRLALWIVVPVAAFFVAIDVTFLLAALHKVLDGGWFPIALGSLAFALMTTWRSGRERLLAEMRTASVPLRAFLASLLASPPPRTAGTAVFLTATPDVAPNALLHSLKHYRVLHAQNVFLTVEFRDEPRVDVDDRVVVESLGDDCWRVTASYGYMDEPDVAHALELCGPSGLRVEPMEVSYFLSREKVVPGDAVRGIGRWRDRVFAAMARNAGNVTDFFNVPANRVVELGTRVQL